MNAIGPDALAGVVKPQHSGKKIGRSVTRVKVCVRRRYVILCNKNMFNFPILKGVRF